jgi:hypothetical protein
MAAFALACVAFVPWLDRRLETLMRAFIAACIVAILIAIGGAVVLDTFVQESSADAFARSSVRI